MLPSSQFVERECRESKKSPDGKRKFGSPSGSGKKKKTFFPGKIRGAVDVLIRIKSLDTGVVHLLFPKQAEDLRELIKYNPFVDDVKAVNWHPQACVWANMTYDSIPTKPVLLAHPQGFIKAATELFDSTELVSDWTILASDNITKLSLEQALELEFTLSTTEPKVEKIEVQATMDDIQADLRVLHRLTCLFARRAGITQADIDKAAESDSD